MSEKNKKITILISTLCLAFFATGLFALSQKKNTISINSLPAGATYNLAGIEGQTPAKVKIKPGKYQLELSLENYQSIKTEVKVPSFWGQVRFAYTLSRLPNTAGRGTTRGGDKKRQENIALMKSKFPYFTSLPTQSTTFYIDIPYKDGRIPVYIFKISEKQGKRDALQWFASHGVKEPSELNIVWRYDKR